MNTERDQIKQLRDLSGAGLMDCKKALVETGQDLEKAIVILRKKGLAKASKRRGQETSEGQIFSYIHTGGLIGVLLHLTCETDFVAKTEEFGILGKNLCMQIAASQPLAIDKEQMSQKIIEQEMEIHRDQLQNESQKNAMNSQKKEKSSEILEKILEGKMKKFFKQNCLLEQDFIRDEKMTIQSMIDQTISKLGENIKILQYARFQIK